MIIAESLIINGKPYKINASLKNIIPAQKVKKENDIDNGRNKVPNSGANSAPSFNGGGGNSNLSKIFNAVDSFVRSRNRRSKLEAVIPTKNINILHFQKPLSLDRFPSTSINPEELEANPTTESEIPESEASQDRQNTEDTLQPPTNRDSVIPQDDENSPDSQTPQEDSGNNQNTTEPQTPENNEPKESQTPEDNEQTESQTPENHEPTDSQTPENQ